MTAKKVLFFEGNTDGTVGGSYFLMYDLILGLDRSKYQPVVGFYADNFLVPKLKAEGIKTIVFNLPDAFSFHSDALNSVLAPVKKFVNLIRRLILPSIRFSRFLKAEEIDLVNVNNSIRSNHPWMIACKIRNVPCITHEMGINTKFTWLSKFLGRRLDSIICLSHAIHDAMKEAGADFPNTNVVHCGIDLDRYQIEESPEALRRKHNIDPESPVIGVVGNVKMWKGQETIVKAMPALVKKYPDIRCLLVGDLPAYAADYHDELRAFIKSEGVEDNVTFAGFQKNSIDYMNLMDIVVHTSIDPEPFGIVTLEAMSLGKPLVSTTIGGPAEVVTNDENGILIQPGDPRLLAEALDSLLSNRELAEKLGKCGLENLHANFTFEKSLSETMKIYESVLAK